MKSKMSGASEQILWLGYLVLEAIQVLCNALGGRDLPISANWRCEGLQSNVISVTGGGYPIFRRKKFT